MKLKSITIENIRSFRERTTIEFDKGFNILIGPNAGGKSNLLDIITIVIRHYFVEVFTVIDQSDQTGFFRNIQKSPLFNPIQNYLDKFIGNESNISSIEIVFELTMEDVKNINEIKLKKEILKGNLRKYRNGYNFIGNIESVCQNFENSDLREGMELRYIIQKYQPPNPAGNNEKAYLSYLNNFELFLILSEEEINLKPIYLYFSPYRAMDVSNLQTNLSARNFYQLYQSYAKSTSKSISSAIELACFYFSQKRRRMEISAKNNGYHNHWINDEEVKLITGYLKKLNYDWDINPENPDINIYKITLKKDGKEFSLSQASSGEKEIMNFLLGIFALNISNGLIIIDEPDLHLHPQWQKLLIELFVELSIKTSNQFIVSTHSAIFIDEKTISNVIRIYRDDTGTSKSIKIREEYLPQVRDILHIVNSYNNEKLFFADKVVLVEGVIDRLIFKKLISFYQSESDKPQVVEVLDVGGKHNFDKYEQLLEEINCEYYIIADLDYVKELAEKDENHKIKALFNIDYSSIDKAIKYKKSLNGKRLSEIIEDAIKVNKITEELKSLWNYMKDRHLKLKDGLTEKDINELREYINQKEEKNIFILYGGDKFEYGEIEDFLPDGYKNSNGVIEFTKSDNFKNWFEENAVERRRLKEIVYKILEINEGIK
ncbi:MAG: AAA family ATPase [Candidatus Marinimicrobia bacterium]|nr:AAA family ATPase [Candidatus Neomarinimicrobiota bacterium]